MRMMFEKCCSLMICRAVLASYPARVRLKMRDPRRQVRRWIARRVGGMSMPRPVVPNDEYFAANIR